MAQGVILMMASLGAVVIGLGTELTTMIFYILAREHLLLGVFLTRCAIHWSG